MLPDLLRNFEIQMNYQNEPAFIREITYIKYNMGHL